MDKFDQMEQKCRDEFDNRTASGIQSIYYVDYKTEKYDSVDCIYGSGATEYAAELKLRDHNSSKTWPGCPEGWIFEKVKYDALMEHKYKGKIYVVMFNDVTCFWDVGNLNLEWFEGSYSGTHDRSYKKKKIVTYLQLKDASHIIRN
jgi:hypothetical protein